MISSNIALRILSGSVLGVSFISLILWLQHLFCILMLIIAIAMLCEWYQITKQSFIHLLIGLILISTSITSLILVGLDNSNKYLLLGYFIIIWSVDIFAMIGGRILHGPKLASVLSPKKTWSGLIVGVVASMCNIYLFDHLLDHMISRHYGLTEFYLIAATGLLAVTAQISDLFVSYFKRYYRIKDSGSIIPGHGGVLDRFDSIILTAPIFLYVNLLTNYSHLN